MLSTKNRGGIAGRSRPRREQNPVTVRDALGPPVHVEDGVFVIRGGRRLLYFGGCDYLRLSLHPAVRAALVKTLKSDGLNVAASRVTTGNHGLYLELESALARFAGVEAAVLAPSGYATNLMVAQSLVGEVTHAFIDQRAHASLVDAARMLRCSVAMFRHRDCADLERRLRRLPQTSRPIVLTDGLFARDGAIAPLAEQFRLISRRGWLLVDDAHGFGVLGANGRGSVEHAGVCSPRIVQSVTLSKAVGVFGGAVLTTGKLASHIRFRSRLFGGSTPMPLPLAAAAIEALRVLRSDKTRRRRLWANASRVKAALRGAGIEVPETPSPVVAVRIAGEKASVKELNRRLRARGIYSAPNRYPGGAPVGCCRFVISSEHSPDQLDRLVSAIAGLKETVTAT